MIFLFSSVMEATSQGKLLGGTQGQPHTRQGPSSSEQISNAWEQAPNMNGWGEESCISSVEENNNIHKHLERCQVGFSEGIHRL